MLKKELRLNKKKQIETVLKQGKKVFTPSLILFYGPAQTERGRAAVIVSAKVSRKAVERNRYKRRIREAIRLNGFYGYDQVAVALKGIKDKTFVEIKKDLERAQAGIMRAKK